MAETRSETPLLTDRYLRALHLAEEVHRHQLRKATAIPYLAHVMSVSAMVLENGGDEDCAIGGLLHGAVEDAADGAAAASRIRAAFGERVAAIVTRCSDSVAVPGQDNHRGAKGSRRTSAISETRMAPR